MNAKPTFPRSSSLSITVAVSVALGLLAPVSVALADPGDHGVVPPKSTAYGNKYSEWSAQWWQFMVSMPASVNPIDPPLSTNKEDKCVLGQRGPVWFLAFSYVGQLRTCSIPEDTALFLPSLMSCPWPQRESRRSRCGRDLRPASMP